MELFQGIAAEQGACVIVVTHDYRALEQFDRLLELDDGRLTEATRATEPLAHGDVARMREP